MRLARLLPIAVGCLLAAAPAASADTARSSDAFVSSIGVNTHVIYDDTAYGNFDLVRDRLRELGVRHIRDGLCGSCAWQHDRLNALAADGIKADLIVGTPRNHTGTMAENLLAVRSRLMNSVSALEAPNEWDMFSGWSTTWVGDVRTYQDQLYAAVKADPALRHLTVIGPSLAAKESGDRLGNLAAQLDRGNMHSYAGGRPPESDLQRELALASKVSGGKPVVATEAGYHNATGQGNNDHPGVDEASAARYLPRMFLEYFGSGVERTYAYELLDERPGRASWDMEASFGLLRSDFSRKPSFVAIRNLIALLRDPGPAVASAEFPLTVTDGPRDLRRLVLRKRDGRVYVALWRSVSRWSPEARATSHVTDAPVTVEFGSAVESVSAYSPVDSMTGTPLMISSGAVSLRLASAPIVLEVTPAAVTAAASPSPAAAPEPGPPASSVTASPAPAAPAPSVPAPVPAAATPAPSSKPAAKRRAKRAAKRKAAARKKARESRKRARRRAVNRQ